MTDPFVDDDVPVTTGHIERSNEPFEWNSKIETCRHYINGSILGKDGLHIIDGDEIRPVTEEEARDFHEALFGK